MAGDQFYFNNPNSLFRTLTEAQLREFIENHIANRLSRKEMLNIYPWAQRSVSFTKDLPYSKSDASCSNCSGTVYVKTAKDNNSLVERKLCPKCNHEFNKKCTCNYCEEKKKAESEREEQRFFQVFDQDVLTSFKIPVALEDLSIMDELKLQIFAELFYDGQKQLLNLKRRKEETKLYKELRKTFLTDPFESFVKRRILKPIASYDPSKYYYNLPVYINRNPEQFNWTINLTENGNLISLEEFTTRNDVKQYSTETLFKLWKEIYSAEILQYIEYNSNKLLKLKLDHFTISFTVHLLIPHFSLAKAFAIIYTVLASTLRYSQAYEGSLQHITTYFRNKLMKVAEEAKTARTFNDFNRPSGMTTDPFHMYILDRVLYVASNYFYCNTKAILGVEYQPKLSSKINEEEDAEQKSNYPGPCEEQHPSILLPDPIRYGDHIIKYTTNLIN